jgi:hypothetical protein
VWWCHPVTCGRGNVGGGPLTPLSPCCAPLTPYVSLCHSPAEGWVFPVLLSAWADRHHINMAYEQGWPQIWFAALPGDQVGETPTAQLLDCKMLPHLRSAHHQYSQRCTAVHGSKDDFAGLCGCCKALSDTCKHRHHRSSLNMQPTTQIEPCEG